MIELNFSLFGLIEALVFQYAARDPPMEEEDHRTEEKNAENEVLQGHCKVGLDVFVGKIDDKRPCEDLGHVAPCHEEGIAPFGFVEVADMVDKAPKQEKNHDLAPELGGDKEEGGDPVSINRDPMLVFRAYF